MSASTPRRTISFALLSLLLCSPELCGQDQAEETNEQQASQPQIADKPKTIDPATLVPQTVATAVTVNFEDSSLREIAEWIQEEQKIPVLFDSKALSAGGIPLGEPVTDQLDDEPLYLLLNRLRSLQLAWYMEDEILHITTVPVAEQRLSTKSYNVGDLLDAGFQREDLSHTIYAGIDSLWMSEDGEGGVIEWLGDVLFVRQTDRMHRRVEGLLAALRKHGRRTFIFDPPQHMRLRETLDENISVEFVDTPLSTAVRELAGQTGIDIRLDAPALRQARVRDREPVSLTLADRKLGTVLHVLLADLNLTWILRDGVLWITSREEADAFQKTAVFDVRDLCRDQNESDELTEAIVNQAEGPWVMHDGEGAEIEFARPGTVVIRHTEEGLREVLDLLETYRKALLASKPRQRDAVDPQEVVTRYYRIHAKTARDLATALPRLISPETWRDDLHPDAPGTILQVTSTPELLDPHGYVVHADVSTTDQPTEQALVVSRAVLIIRQTRAVHEEIAKVIRRVEQGDPQEGEDDFVGGGLGGMGGGGFGSGFFSVQ